MGYSYAQEAGRTLENLLVALRGENPSKVSNAWTVKGVEYFWERGTEQSDGAMTGTVMRFSTGRKVGSFRVEANGTITRFPTSTAKQRDKALEHGNGRRSYILV